MAKKYHPDSVDNMSEKVKEQNEELFKLVSNAYEVLSNKITRRNYDDARFHRETFGEAGANSSQAQRNDYN